MNIPWDAFLEYTSGISHVPVLWLFIHSKALIVQDGPLASLFGGFLITHIQTHGRTPLNEWSARRRDLYLHRTTQQTNIHAPSGSRTRDPSNQAAVDLRLRPRGCRDQHCDYYCSFYFWHTDTTIWIRFQTRYEKIHTHVLNENTMPWDVWGWWMCTHIPNMALDGGTWLVHAPACLSRGMNHGTYWKNGCYVPEPPWTLWH
jgi:hypothetical protein